MATNVSYRLNAILFLLVVASAPASARPFIDTIVIFDDQAYAAIPDRHTYALTLGVRINQLLKNSGYDELNVNAYANPTAVSLASSGTLGQNILTEARNNAQVKSIRDNQDADLVIVVAPSADPNNFLCGASFTPPLYKSAPNPVSGDMPSESHAFIWLRYSPSCEAVMDHAAPHEFGHTLFAEHQQDENGDTTKPAQHNHGYRFVSGNGSIAFRTTMEPYNNNEWEPYYSTVALAHSSGEPYGDFQFSRVADFIGDETWDYVSTYRPLPPDPGSATCLGVFEACHLPGCALWRFIFSAQDATSYRIERDTWGGGYSFYDNASGGLFWPHLGGNNIWWRIRGENSAGVGDWCYIYTTGQCQGDGGARGGLIP